MMIILIVLCFSIHMTFKKTIVCIVKFHNGNNNNNVYIILNIIYNNNNSSYNNDDHFNCLMFFYSYDFLRNNCLYSNIS